MKLTIVFALGLFLTPTFSLAETTSNCDIAINCLNSNHNGTGGTDTANTDTGTTTTDESVSETTTDMSAMAGAYEEAMKAQMMAAAMAGLGAGIAAMGIPQCPRIGGQAMCALGFAGLALAMAAGATAANAMGTMDQLTAGDGTSPITDGSPDAKDGSVDQAQLDRLKNDYAKAGYTLNKDGSMKFPNGKTVTEMNAANLKQAGLSTAEANQVMNGLKDLQAKADEKAKALAEANGGKKAGDAQGSGSGGNNSLSTASMGAAGGSGSGEAMGERGPASMLGFAKQYGDSSIGVAGADIFMMVEKRVGEERKAMGH